MAQCAHNSDSRIRLGELMKNYRVFKAFVDVVQKADLSDTIEGVRPALNKLNAELRAAGMSDKMTWEEALKKALSE